MHNKINKSANAILVLIAYESSESSDETAQSLVRTSAAQDLDAVLGPARYLHLYVYMMA